MDAKMINTIKLAAGIFLASLGYYLFVIYSSKPHSIAIVTLALFFAAIGMALFMTTGNYYEEKRIN